MLLLLNTTKTMDLDAPVPNGLQTTAPRLLSTAQKLVGKVSGMTPLQLAELMSVSDKLAAQTHKNFSVWGRSGQPRVPALFAFTGLIFKHLDASGLGEKPLDFARKHLRILSGLYGVLAPFDLIEAYRLEMGYKLPVDDFSNLTQFWKARVTESLDKDLAPKEPIVSVASQEYMKTLDIKKLNRSVILPVFKEERSDGSYKNVVVHAKKARGALIRYAIQNQAQKPEDLMGFSEMGWQAQAAPPHSGTWLFTRPEKQS